MKKAHISLEEVRDEQKKAKKIHSKAVKESKMAEITNQHQLYLHKLEQMALQKRFLSTYDGSNFIQSGNKKYHRQQINQGFSQQLSLGDIISK